MLANEPGCEPVNHGLTNVVSTTMLSFLAVSEEVHSASRPGTTHSAQSQVTWDISFPRGPVKFVDLNHKYSL